VLKLKTLQKKKIDNKNNTAFFNKMSKNNNKSSAFTVRQSLNVKINKKIEKLECFNITGQPVLKSSKALGIIK